MSKNVLNLLKKTSEVKFKTYFFWMSPKKQSLQVSNFKNLSNSYQ